MRYLFALFLLFTFILPNHAHAATADLSISAKNIRFSNSTLYVGDHVRIYATIKNIGDVDMTAQVFFYQGAVLIGSSQWVSVVAGGSGDDVYVDYTVPSGQFNIRALIQGADPTDDNSSNDSATTPLYTPVSDEDRDGALDSADNCASVSNADQLDSDHDGQGDACDTDDDNDGLMDSEEATLGTSPTTADTDGDGVSDKTDAYPVDPNKSVKEVVVPPAPTPTPTPAPKTATSTKKVAAPEPAPVVAGATDAVSSPTESTAAPSTASEEPPVLLAASLQTSPDARFTYKQIDWRTYEFEALPPEGMGGYTYGWDFGDGATSVQQKITHAFPRAGKYTITLAIADQTGKITSDAEVLDISFFHIDNPLVQLTLGLLLLILLGLLVFIVRLRRREV